MSATCWPRLDSATATRAESSNFQNDFADLRAFASRLSPSLGSAWLDIPGGLTPAMSERLGKLRGFRFKRHPYHNLPVGRLRAIEDFLQKRIAEISEYGSKADDLIAIKPKRFSVKQVKQRDGLVQLKAHIHADPFITIKELAELLGVSQVTLSKWLAKLKASGEVRRVGADKNGYWKLGD